MPGVDPEDRAKEPLGLVDEPFVQVDLGALEGVLEIGDLGKAFFGRTFVSLGSGRNTALKEILPKIDARTFLGLVLFASRHLQSGPLQGAPQPGH